MTKGNTVNYKSTNILVKFNFNIWKTVTMSGSNSRELSLRIRKKKSFN